MISIFSLATALDAIRAVARLNVFGYGSEATTVQRLRSVYGHHGRCILRLRSEAVNVTHELSGLKFLKLLCHQVEIPLRNRPLLIGSVLVD